MVTFIAGTEIPKMPNFLTFLERYLDNSPWGQFIYNWESIIFSMIIGCIVAFVFYLGSSNREMIPSGIQNFFEWVVETFELFIFGILGKEGKEFVPFLGTLFIYILSMNLFGLVPFMASPSSNFNVGIALAICVFGMVQYLNIKNMGFKGFLHHLAGSPSNTIGWIMAPLMLPIELLTQISRPITLALRLFGNILGEKILVAFFAVMGVTMFYYLPIQLPFMILGLLTNFMQAMVFTLLSTIYILLSVPHSVPHSEEIHINNKQKGD